MDELKTLKYFQKEFISNDKKFCFVEELRLEAIKCFKNADHPWLLNICPKCGGELHWVEGASFHYDPNWQYTSDCNYYIDETQAFIKWFFNLSEEELS